MILFRIILWAILITFVLRFIFNFLLPVVGMTSAVQGKMREMQKQMEEMQKKHSPVKEPKKQQIDGEYIDYEEVK